MNDTSIVTEEQDHELERSLLVLEDQLSMREYLSEGFLPILGPRLPIILTVVERILVSAVKLALYPHLQT